MRPETASPVGGGPSPARPLWPSRKVVTTLVSLATAAAMVRAGLLEPVVGSIVDQAVRNIITLILGFSGLMTLVIWFIRESGHSPAMKRAVVGGLLAAVAVGVAVLRIERVSGDLVPEFAFRWSPPRDRLLSTKPAVAGAAAGGEAIGGPWTATPRDFWRFLGPDGTASIESPALDPDWQARPPRQIWRRPIGAGWSGFATCGDHAATLEQRGDDEVVACYSSATGEPEWTVAVPARHETVLGGVGPRSTPTIRDGVVYAAGATGWLHAIDGATGRVLWKKNVLADLGIDAAAHAAAVAWGRAGSPLVLDDVVIVPGGGPRRPVDPATGGTADAVSIVAYDRGSGDRRWTAGSEQISYCTPVLVSFGGREMLVVVNEGSVIAHDPADGSEIWRFPWAGHSNSDASCSQPVVLGGGRILVSKGYGIGAAVFEAEGGDAAASGKEPWSMREVWHDAANLKTKFTNVALRDGHAYGLSDGILECVRLADGRRRWKGGRYGQGQVLRVGDLLLVQAESGEVVLVDATPERHVVRGRLAAIEGQTWNNPCLTGNWLLVRNAEEAACYELPLAESVAAP